MNKKIAVIGAGAAGMMAAYSAACNGANVTIYEKNEKAGKKLYITGKGRCNVTNASDIEELFQNVVTNRKFMYSAFYTFSNENVMEFFENHGLKLKVERGNRVFPESDRSSDVINTLKSALKKLKVDIVYHCEIERLIVEEIGENDSVGENMQNNGRAAKKITGIVTSDGTKEYFDSVIIATGGVSYPVTGSDGKGHRLLEANGHSITKLRPALVPMNVSEEFVKSLQGLTLKNVRVRFYENGKKKPIYEDFGEMLFTHFGVSGPVILSASSIIGKKVKQGNIELVIDMKPALDREQLDERILRDFNENINKDFRNSLDKLLPKSMIPVIIDYCGIDAFKKVNEISREERGRLVSAIKGLKVSISSLRGFHEAIITGGGVNVKEIHPASMESRLIKNLYIAGELIDVDALTGGYNLQIAWSTGWLAGQSAAGGNGRMNF